jgi:O-antigen ligase
MTNHQGALEVGGRPLAAAADAFGLAESGLAARGMMLWLSGAIVLLPVRIIELPSNLELVDVWALVGMPLVWAALIHQRKPFSLAYTVPMYAILIGSMVSTLAAPNPVRSLIVLLKEFYLFVWCATLSVALSTLSERNRRRLLVLWTGIAVLHGLLIGAQFFSAGVWRFTAGLGGKAVMFEAYRPAGLFISEHAGDANSAAFYQLMGIVPLVASRPSRLVAAIAGGVLVSSILFTGSMGTTLALLTGLAVATMAGALLVRRFALGLVRVLPVAVVVAGLLAALVASNPDRLEHFERIFLGRADRSSEGRLALWQRGVGVLIDRRTFLWGVGPENFREVDGMDKQLHNDLLAFLVERGVLGGLGLALLAGTALGKGVLLVRRYVLSARAPRLEMIVFPAAIVALVVVSMTHQIFHRREMWFLLALQQAMLLTWREGALFDADG